MTNWSCLFGRQNGPETASKLQQSMTQAPGTCGQVGHRVQSEAGEHMLRWSLPEDLIQCSKMEPNHRIFQATPALILQGHEDQWAEERELGSQSGTHKTKYQ